MSWKMDRAAILNKLERKEEFLKKFAEFAEMKLQDVMVSDDIKKIRDQIDRNCKEYHEAQKRFDRAEKEYLEAKVELFIRGEEKDKLTEKLKTIIQKNEFEKAQKLSSLVGKLEIKSKMIGLGDNEKS
uniref:RAB6-interacting golgin n=1 Tax=Riptortus pedestris TaxID=329032 RepID=R4WCR2_RIPPE|nr:unkown protein [Riptortus pedestris]